MAVDLMVMMVQVLDFDLVIRYLMRFGVVLCMECVGMQGIVYCSSLLELMQVKWSVIYRCWAIEQRLYTPLLNYRQSFQRQLVECQHLCALNYWHEVHVVYTVVVCRH